MEKLKDWATITEVVGLKSVRRGAFYHDVIKVKYADLSEAIKDYAYDLHDELGFKIDQEYIDWYLDNVYRVEPKQFKFKCFNKKRYRYSCKNARVMRSRKQHFADVADNITRDYGVKPVKRMSDPWDIENHREHIKNWKRQRKTQYKVKKI